MSLVTSKAIQSAYTEGEPIPDEIKQKIDELDRRYSPVIGYRGFGILGTTPSQEFDQLTKRAAQLSFRRHLKAICQILDLDLNIVTARLEQSLLQTGTTLDEEKDNARSMADAFVHPQGWPILWFISDFHVQVSHLLYEVVDEALLKQRFEAEHLEAIWRIIQPSDPEYSQVALSPKPEDLPPLMVHSKDEWISRDHQEDGMIIEDSFAEEWITAFEFTQLAQDTPYHREYVTQTHVRSALIRPQAVGNLSRFDESEWQEKVITYHPAENLTWQQYREALLKGHFGESSVDEDILPFVSHKQCFAEFVGFHTIACLSSKIIRSEELEIDSIEEY